MDTDDNELAEIRRAALSDPRNGALRYRLGAELAQHGKYDDAVLEMTAAVALDPLLHIARLQLGLLHLTMGQPQHTLTVLAPLEDLDDSAAVKHFKRGLEALALDDLRAAVEHLRRGIGLNSENAPLNRDMAMLADRVQTALETSTPAAQTKDGPDGVRTDFSLYGVTRH